MAKSNGILKIEGTIEDLTFYKQDGQHYVRRKGGVSKDRIAGDPNYVRTRENNSEFGHCGNASRLLRLALGSMVARAKDSKLHSRLVQTLSRIKNLDTQSPRGQRLVGNGLDTPMGKQMLRGFDFNIHAPLQTVLEASYVVDATIGKLTFADLIPMDQVNFPEGATHFSLQTAFSVVDFGTGQSAIGYSPIENLPLNNQPTSVGLTVNNLPTGSGIRFFVLMISFFQEVNGVQYSLKNEGYNVLHVLEVL